MKTRIFILLCSFFLINTLAHSAEQKKYKSPDGVYVAVVAAVDKSEENSVIIKTRHGKTICSKSYLSDDGTHGFVVEKASWTPDSKFFVYSMSNSGGHQPWHFPTDFCSIIDKSIRSLDDHVGPITNFDFGIKKPDIVKGTKMGKDIDDILDFEVSLGSLPTNVKKK